MNDPDDKPPEEAVVLRPDIQAIDLNSVGDAVVEIMAQAMRGPVSIYLAVVDDETGKVASTTNLAPEQVVEFLTWMVKQQRAGDFTFEGRRTH